MPPEKSTPTNIPILAIIITIYLGATRAPIAEFRKLTASLLTPTINADTAIAIKIITTNIDPSIPLLSCDISLLIG